MGWRNLRLLALPVMALLPATSAAAAPDWDLSKNWKVTLGAGAGVAPRYEGSDNLQLLPIPYFDIEWNDRLSLSIPDGLHFAALKWNDLAIGLAGDIRLPRKQSDDNALRHLGTVGLGIEIGGYVAYNPRGFEISLEARHDIAGGHGGTVVEFNARAQLPIGKNFGVEFGPSLNWADKNYMHAYFGINSKQSAQSGYNTFSPKAGFKDVGFSVSAAYEFDEHWRFLVQTDYAYLLGDAARSPIVADGRGSRHQFSLDLVLAYRF